MYELGTQLTVLYALEPAEQVAGSATEADVAWTGTVVLVEWPSSSPDGLVDHPGLYVLEDAEGRSRSVIPEQVAPPAEAERWFRARLDRVHHTGLHPSFVPVLVHLDVEGAFEATFGCSAEY
jgi:hypothetical protein